MSSIRGRPDFCQFLSDDRILILNKKDECNQLAMKKEIATVEEIKELVNKFYEKVNKDALLAPVFNEETGIDWEEHLPKMYKFWSTQLIGTGDYMGRPFPPHTELAIGTQHFERWLKLFLETVDENFTGITAETAKTKARNIAAVFQYKLGLLDNA
jgi:hemoglobin